MNKQLSLKAKTIISFVLFALIFAGLTLIASYCDLAISKILTKNTLKDGAYICSSTFALFFEAVGSCPIYLVPSVAGAIVFWYGVHHNKKWISLIGAIAGFVGFFLTCKDITHYYTEAVTASINNGIPIKPDYNGDFYIHLVEAFVAITETVLLMVAWSRVSKETNDALIRWIPVAAIAVVGYVLVELVKSPIGRVRFRTMNAIGDTTYSQFTDWWVVNGKRAPYDYLPSDHCKSFPSGHTYSGALVYTFICFPDLIKSWHDKKWVRPVLYAVTIIYTMIVGISRIVAGAHYMSDVLFGGTMSFLCMVLGREIFIFKGAHLKALFNKPYELPKLSKEVQDTTLDYDKIA